MTVEIGIGKTSDLEIVSFNIGRKVQKSSPTASFNLGCKSNRVDI